MLDERYLLKQINRKRFPFRMLGILFLAVAFISIIIKISPVNDQGMWSVGEAELLLYMIINAVVSMIVKPLSRHIKETILGYVINLALVILLFFALLGSSFGDTPNTFSIYSALVLCFFASVFLTYLIRQVIKMLDDQ